MEAYIEDTEHDIHALADNLSYFVEQVEGEDFYQRFRVSLPTRDMEILEYRIHGFPYEEIAERMGYSNHSGVLKRINAIKKAFIAYEQQ